ncbi:MAG: hypothetical protein M1827_004721 [Pycnora praestabilis]|nr:MAG: hypothetical protein M1827_004721 [Pycnora praestabilis]
MSNQKPTANDDWSSEAYKTSASFVPKLTTKVLQYLDPQPTDSILDIGCGDGSLTAYIAAKARTVVGVDASKDMIEAAKKNHETENSTYEVVDCRYLREWVESMKQQKAQRDCQGKLEGTRGNKFDKIFSNAALHWILCSPNNRLSVFSAVHSLLKPGGLFVFEMGGVGNVAEVHTAFLSALIHRGLSVNDARDSSPWFFPSEKWMRNTIEGVGFVVEKLELEYRPTRLTDEERGGLEGWVRLMGAQFLRQIEEGEESEGVVREVCESLRSVVRREEDGSVWLGYVRLRAMARKAA